MTLKNETYSRNQKERGAKEVRLWLAPEAAAAWGKLSATVPAIEKGKLLSDVILAHGNGVTAKLDSAVTVTPGPKPKKRGLDLSRLTELAKTKNVTPQAMLDKLMRNRATDNTVTASRLLQAADGDYDAAIQLLYSEVRKDFPEYRVNKRFSDPEKEEKRMRAGAVRSLIKYWQERESHKPRQ